MSELLGKTPSARRARRTAGFSDEYRWLRTLSVRIDQLAAKPDRCSRPRRGHPARTMPPPPRAGGLGRVRGFTLTKLLGKGTFGTVYQAPAARHRKEAHLPCRHFSLRSHRAVPARASRVLRSM